MIGIDLFAGAGGMSYGAIMAGINVILAVEIDQNAAHTYVHNHQKVRMFKGDIRTFTQLQVPRRKEELLVFGGPPCAGFSTSNQKTRNSRNPSNWLFEEYLRVVQLYSPDWLVFENVAGILETEQAVFVDRILERLRRLGYKLTHGVLNACDFGVPQIRSRFFIVGSKNGVAVQFPTRTCQSPPSVADAIHDLPKLPNGCSEEFLPYHCPPRSQYAKMLRRRRDICANNAVTRSSEMVIQRYEHVPQGGNWRHIPGRLMKHYKDRSRCHTGIYHRLDPAKPSIVLGNYRKNMLIHPVENRGLSVREAARLQSFPDSFVFKGSIGFQQQQVSNAVPPLLAHAIFRAVILAAN
jgi:DNA (cytosine-5)-methyltransferase 1